MTTKNPDYSDSAVNLHNEVPIKLQAALFAYQEASQKTIEAEAAAAILPEVVAASKARDHKSAMYTAVMEAIDECGSWQNVGDAIYAVKQERKTPVHSAGMARQVLGKMADDFITVEEKVDKKKLEQAIKDGFITAASAEQFTRLRTSYTYIIEVGLK